MTYIAEYTFNTYKHGRNHGRGLGMLSTPTFSVPILYNIDNSNNSNFINNN